MNWIRKMLMVCIILSLMNCLFLYTVRPGSLSVGPTVVHIPNALRGAEYRTTIFLYNNNDFDENVTFNATESINDMISFYAINDTSNKLEYIIVPKNSISKVYMELKIPENLSNGNYSGTIFVMQQTQKIDNNSKGNYSTVNIVIPINVTFNVVGTENLNLTVYKITTRNTEINYPLEIRIFFNNTGNVIAIPIINITFTKDGMYIDKLQSTDKIQPQTIHTKLMIWNTTGKIAGHYIAHITITLRSKIIMMKNLSFQLLPPGTFTRKGELKSLSYSGTIGKNKIIKILAKFQNTGEIETKAKFVGEVYLNGQLIDTIESEELSVPAFSSATLISYLRLGKETGEYTIKGFVIYEGKKTNVTTLSFQLNEPLSTVIVTGIVLSMGLGLIMMAYFIHKGSIKLYKVIPKRVIKNTNKKSKINKKKR